MPCNISHPRVTLGDFCSADKCGAFQQRPCNNCKSQESCCHQSCPILQRCSLGLERLGLEAVSRRFFGTSRLVSVLKVERLALVSISRVWKNRTSRYHLGLEDITSRSRSRDFSLVNMHAMHHAFGYIMKEIMDLTCKNSL